MRTITLLRDPIEPGVGLFGKLNAGSFECYTVENPDLCMPAGTWRFFWRKDSPKHGSCYEAEGIPGRTNIQIHVANFAHELLGCIAPGRAIGDILDKDGVMRRGVMGSRDALDGLVADLGKLEFNLMVISRTAPGQVGPCQA